jgi:putative glutamine amidotransferase
VQDLPSERPSPVAHQRTRQEKTRRDHRVAIAPGTLLSAIVGAPEAAVNSRHHQAIDRVARGLAISAVAPDGVVEGVEAADDSWLVAVQWHPENLAGDPVSERLFAEFLRIARARLSAR